MKIGKNLGQNMQWVGRRTTKQTGMQITVGGLDCHLFTDQAAKSDRDRRRLRIPHAGVADQRAFGF
jgi:hypothetical protein